MIDSVLRSADITHISNEVSFDANCPTPDPWTLSLFFCSNPGYIALLEDAGTDVVELTGNHLLDYGPANLLTTLDMYDQLGWKYYGGGRDLQDALQPALLENNGNKLAFIGCDFPGPPRRLGHGHHVPVRRPAISTRWPLRSPACARKATCRS